MKSEELKERIPVSEFTFSTSRSSGPGGQNVNKVNTRVELRFDIKESSFLSKEEKSILTIELHNRINSEGELIITSQSERTQYKNRQKTLEKFFTIVSKALTENPERKPTSRTNKSKSERLEEKKKRGYIKKMRKDSGASEDDS